MSKFQIPKYLLDAYEGTYPREDFPNLSDQAYMESIKKTINNHTPKEHLHTYLQWNGILGWDEQIWNLAQGSWFIGQK